MSNIVNKIIIVGRVECSRGNTEQPLYITITNNTTPNPPYQTVILLPAQSIDQSWCLVKTTMMQDCFVIASYPNMNKVLVATNDPVEGYTKAKHIRVETLTKPIVEGEPLPINVNELYLFNMEPERSGGYYLCSQSNIFPDTVMQGGYDVNGSSTTPPAVNDFVNIHNRQRSIREWFWFENNPTRA